ncbi:MAG: sigma-70 family RNA polymerase sigma factor [Planctomycetota bacterium]
MRPGSCAGKSRGRRTWCRRAAAESLTSFEGRSSTYTWLYGILLNKFRRWLRRRKKASVSLQAIAVGDERRAEEFFETDYPGPEKQAQKKESARHVRRAIDQLGADHRSVITLRYIEGMSYGEIAEALNCPLGTVKSRIHYALQKIGHSLNRAGPLRR